VARQAASARRGLVVLRDDGNRAGQAFASEKRHPDLTVAPDEKIYANLLLLFAISFRVSDCLSQLAWLALLQWLIEIDRGTGLRAVLKGTE
jgi:hypothetical protein